MLPNQTQHPGGRATRVYNAEERAVIDVFKTQYMAATTPTARKTIAQVHILPAIFNFWAGWGQTFNDTEMEMRIQVHIFLMCFQRAIYSECILAITPLAPKRLASGPWPGQAQRHSLQADRCSLVDPAGIGDDRNSKYDGIARGRQQYARLVYVSPSGDQADSGPDDWGRTGTAGR